jgi:signal transduction histidine kinase
LIPELIYFIPLISYDIFLGRFKLLPALILVPISINISNISIPIYISLFLITIMGYLLKKRTTEINTLKNNYINFIDDTKEFSSKLENKNKELMEKQDYEVNLATLNERNRIAREIHDNVGHLLSSSLIQIGAVIAISKEDNVREFLTNVNRTLSTGMDSIRESIHNIHEDSIDLYSKLRSLIENFTFCKATLDYKIEEELSIKAKYSIIFIVKESLSNVMKHSDATLVSIKLFEHPITSLEILIFKEPILFIVFILLLSITQLPHIPTLCPPLIVRYPCFISSS